jgi:hypothetical protein
MVRPWARAGYTCMIVDLAHPPGEHVGEDGIIRVGADVREFLPPRDFISMVFAFPPCTDMATSGAKHFKRKGLKAITESLALVEACRRICEWSGAPWMIENPISTLATYWRTPDFKFDPHHFAGYHDGASDAYTKKTCLWVGGGFKMPARKSVEPVLGSRMRDLPDSAERADLRSVTPMGFAEAVFAAHHGGKFTACKA